MRPIPDYGDVFTLEGFIHMCKNYSFIDYDGTGYYGNDKEYSNKYAKPSDIVAGKIDKNYTHVIWFNK